MMIEIDLTAHQAIRPFGADREVPAHQEHRTALGGAADEDHLPAKRRMQVELEVLEHRAARWRGFGGLAVTSSVGGDVGMRTGLQFGCAIDVLNGIGPILTEYTQFAQLGSGLKNAPLYVRFNAIPGATALGIGKRTPIQTLASAMGNPTRHHA